MCLQAASSQAWLLVAEGQCDWACKPHPLSVKPTLPLLCSTGALSACFAQVGTGSVDKT